MQTIRIGIVVYNGVAAINVTSPTEVFTAASRWAKRNSQPLKYDVQVLSLSGQHITTDSNLRLGADEVLSGDVSLDTVIIPGGTGIFADHAADPIARWLSSKADPLRRIASVCTGIFAIARTGLLDGRRVTTHWAHMSELKRQYPALRPEADAIFMRDEKFYSSAGASAGFDLALALVEEDLGDSAALAVARELLVYRRRDGGQRQYADVPALESAKGGTVAQLSGWISSHLEDDLSVTKLADYVGLSYNELVRQFREAFGTTPAAFVKAMRMDVARRKLLNGQSVAAIARRFRFKSKGYFTQEFKWRFGITPEDYKKRFSSAYSRFADDLELGTDTLPATTVHRDFAGVSMYGCHVNSGAIKKVA